MQNGVLLLHMTKALHMGGCAVEESTIRLSCTCVLVFVFASVKPVNAIQCSVSALVFSHCSIIEDQVQLASLLIEVYQSALLAGMYAAAFAHSVLLQQVVHVFQTQAAGAVKFLLH